MELNQFEKKMKVLLRAENKRRIRIIKDGGDPKYFQPVATWVDAIVGAHWQVRNEQFKDCNGKCVFDPIGVRAYSYDHWKFVTVIKGRVVFNAYRYSVTTGTHQSHVRYLLEALGIKIDLEVNTRNDLDCFKSSALPEMYSRLFELEIAAVRKNSKDSTNAERRKDIARLKRDIALARKLGAVCTREAIATLKATAERHEAERLRDITDRRVRSNELARQSRDALKRSFQHDDTGAAVVPLKTLAQVNAESEQVLDTSFAS